MATTIKLPISAWVSNANWNAYEDSVVLSDTTSPLAPITIVPPNTPFVLADDANALRLVALFNGIVLAGPS